VGVGLHGRVQAYTDARGRALITQLQAYNSNTITLNANDLPIGAEIDNISADVVPPQRSTVKVLFPVRTGQSALLKLVLEDDTEVPAGAQLRIVDDIDPSRVFYVARKGQVFVTGLSANNHLQVRFAEKACALKLAVPSPNAQTIWRPAPQTCKEMSP
jgi:outer membrane usher protein